MGFGYQCGWKGGSYACLIVREICVWQVFLAHLWKLTLAHLWQVAGQRSGMEMRCASGWSVAEARSTAAASITP